MREIKFRAWDGKTRKMYHNVQDMYDGMSDEDWSSDAIYDTDIPIQSFGEVVGAAKAGKIHLMQFTSLLDRNGKEIYESDVVEYPNYGEPRRDKVEYRESGFSPFAFADFGDEGYEARYCEVIGNIYENPDLLKQQ